MTVTHATFVDQLLAAVPEIEPVVSEHLEDQDGELLLHLLMSDLLRFAVHASRAGEGDVLPRLLAVVDRSLREGDNSVENAVALSFVAHVGYGAGETAEFIASWPAGLLAERDRQLGA